MLPHVLDARKRTLLPIRTGYIHALHWLSSDGGMNAEKITQQSKSNLALAFVSLDKSVKRCDIGAPLFA